jgi:hypothetical protein
LDKALLARACSRDGKTCIDNVLLVTGYLNQGTFKAIKDYKSKTEFDTVCFHSGGGNKDAAIEIGQWINDKNLNTCMAEKYLTTNGYTVSPTLCASACPYIFAMGQKRTALGSDFSIGIHSTGTQLGFGKFTYRISVPGFSALSGYESMLTGGGHSGSEKHVKMLHESLDIDFDKMKYLTSDEQEAYALFTEHR